MMSPPWLLTLSLLALGCRTDDERPRDTHTCVPLSASPCACGLSAGSMRCSAVGVFESCVCEAASAPAQLDAGAAEARDAAESPLDAAASAESSTGTGGRTDDLPCAVGALLRKHCSTCHGQERAFGAPMSLVTWDDLHSAAPNTPDRNTRELALERMQSSQSPMPPAPHARVSTAEIQLFERWLADGAPKQTCQTDAGSELQEAGAPASVKVPKPADCEATYELTAHGVEGAENSSKFRVSSMPARDGNQYHCFYFKPPYAADSGMLWFEPILDDTASLHHWILYATDNAKNPAGSSGPCNGAGADTYFVAGWAPGAENTALPGDVSLALPSGPNAGLILEVHYYNNTGMPKFDATGLRFCTAKQSARAHTAGVHFLGSEGICIPPAARGFEVNSACTPRSDLGEIHITGVWPHMHKRARRMRLLIKRRGGASEVLHDEVFDFNAQLFFPKADVVIRAGDRIETTCVYDNDSNEQIAYGERTQDEMCYAFVTAWPAGALSSTALFSGSLLQVNRCGGDLSILESCHGLDDSPALITHPP
jgi:hypothetical protein